MVCTFDRWRTGAGFLAVVGTALLVWFGTGLSPLWPLLWFAPLPVLAFASRSSWRDSALAATLAWFLGSFNKWQYFHGVLGMPGAAVVLLFITLALGFTLASALFRALLRRGAPWSALVAFPAVWVSFEYLLSLRSIHGTGGSLSYTQLNFLPFLQLASLTGPWGLSFLLLLFPSSLAVGLHLRHRAPKRALAVVGTSLGVIGMALVFGAVRLALPTRSPQVKVGLIASDLPANFGVAKRGMPTTRVLEAYRAQVAALATRGAQVIVLPEKLGIVVDPGTRECDALFQSLANSSNVVIVVGLVRVNPQANYNEARVYAPGVPVLDYAKQHMLPPFESMFKPGTGLTLLSESSGTWGVAICKDMDFTPLSRRYGKAGTGLMLVPAWDFGVDHWEHGHKAVMRALEDGFSVVRAAKQGDLTVCDNRGRILAEAASGSSPYATLVADVPTTHAPTLYQILGDWFAWVVLAMLALSLLGLFRGGDPTDVQ